MSLGTIKTELPTTKLQIYIKVIEYQKQPEIIKYIVYLDTNPDEFQQPDIDITHLMSKEDNKFIKKTIRNAIYKEEGRFFLQNL